MTPYPNTVAGVLEVLERSFGGVQYVHSVLEQVLKANKKWGSRDRSFVAEHTYEIVRHWRYLWALLGEEPSLKRQALKRLFWVYYSVVRGEEIPEWAIEKGISLEPVCDVSSLPLVQKESYADWFSERMETEVGVERWTQLAKALNQPTQVILRVNTLKANREQLLEALRAENIEAAASDIAPTAVVVEGRPSLTRLKTFEKGWFEVQDGGSQKIAPWIQAAPGMKIIDACSGAGGKTLQMAAESGNKAEIIAMDVEPFKLKELEKRALRAGVTCVRTAPIHTSRDVQRLHEWADALLLDVPCSGTGVIRRDVDTKWKLKPEHLERTMALQKRILLQYTDALKPGGRLVYATCSVLSSENEGQIDQFLLEKKGEYELLHQERFSPEHAHSDGYFISVLTKNS